MALNILLSTTRQWNCGDDFIAFGVKNLLQSCFEEHINFFVYNRAPELHRLRINKLSLDINGKKHPLDLSAFNNKVLWPVNNSWNDNLDLNLMDKVVFAGTPEWLGPMVSPLNTAIVNAKTKPKVMHLGIGSFEGTKNLTFDKLPALDKAVLEHSSMITVRDSVAAKILSPLKTELLSCPALFSSSKEKIRKSKKKIALSAQGTSGGQPIKPEVYAYCRALFKELAKQYDVAIVCHYILDCYAFQDLGLPIIYSYDAKDYLEIYDKFDLTVTTRVHGAGICASMGIPGVVIHHSDRSETVKGFMSHSISPDIKQLDQALKLIDELNIKENSTAILLHKKDQLALYRSKILSAHNESKT